MMVALLSSHAPDEQMEEIQALNERKTSADFSRF